MVLRWWGQWPAANIGVACGRQSGIVVLDVDPRNGGLESINALVAEHGTLPWGPIAKTGGGGQHYYYRYPQQTITNHHPLPGIDIQSDGQQVVVAPSVHSTGVSYEWYDEAGPDEALPEMPAWLLALACTAPETGATARKPPMETVIPQGKRNAEIASRLGAARRIGATEKELFAFGMAINEERCFPPLDRTEIAQIAASVARYEPSESIVLLGEKPKEKKAKVAAHTLTMAELEHEELPALRMAVPGLMPVGLALLAGRLKMGKSWMMLGISIAIALGGIALGQYPVEDGDVLYVAYEDNKRRIKTRGKTLLPDGNWPARLHMAPSGFWPRRDDGGLEAIDAWLGSHPEASMVVVDTLQRFRGGDAGEGDKNAYAADYNVSGELQELALRHDVVIVAVHHFRKSLSETDWVDQISGTNGIAGAADTIMGFERKRGERTAILMVTGRDIDEGEYALVFDAEQYGWVVSGTAEELRVSEEAFEFTRAIWEVGRGDAVHYHKIAEVIGKKRNTVHRMGQRLADRGDVLGLGGGMYKAVHAVQTVETRFKNHGQGAVQSLSTPVHDIEDAPTFGQLGQGLDRGVSTVFEANNDSLDSLDSKTSFTSPQPPRPGQGCAECGGDAWSLRVGGRWMCAVCHPHITAIEAVGRREP